MAATGPPRHAGRARGTCVGAHARMPTFTSLAELSPNVLAALAGAGATLIAALINLRIAWRREVLDRAARARTSTRARRGLLVAIAILVVATGVGGYAGAMYVMQRDRQHTQDMRADLQQQIVQIKDSAARFEQTRLGERATIEADARLLDARRRGADGALAAATLGPCRARAITGDGGEAPACSENEALGATLCAPVPAGAQVYEVQPYARWHGDAADWRERRVALGGRLGSGEVGAQPTEQPEANSAKLVCVAFATWDSQRALEARVVVRYVPAEGTAAPAAVAPTVSAQAAVKTGE